MAIAVGDVWVDVDDPQRAVLIVTGITCAECGQIEQCRCVLVRVATDQGQLDTRCECGQAATVKVTPRLDARRSEVIR